MADLLKTFSTLIGRFLKTPSGLFFKKTGFYLLNGVILLILCYQVIQIGFRNILSELPSHPLFYILFLFIYFALPVTEFLTYRQHWTIGFWKSQLIFLNKRVLNKTILGYSGEVQFFFWLQNEIGVKKKEAYEVVRDNNILSTLASASIAVVLISVFFISGKIKLITLYYDGSLLLPITIGLAIFILLVLFRKYRSFFFSMEKKKATAVFTLHSLRMLFLVLLQVLQWHVVIPEVSLSSWFTLVSLQLILSRIPFLPNKDLVFLAAGIELGRHIDIPIEGLAGLLLVSHVLDKIVNLFFVLLYSSQKRRQTSNG